MAKQKVVATKDKAKTTIANIYDLEERIPNFQKDVKVFMAMEMREKVLLDVINKALANFKASDMATKLAKA